MGSWTSRGAPEGSGGKDLYMGSCQTDTGLVLGVIGIVPGPPKGFQRSTRWGHLPRGATWAVRGCDLAYMGQGHQPQEAHAPRDKERKSPKGGRHLRGALGRRDSSLAAPFLGGRAKAAPPPPSPLSLYIVGGGEGIQT